MVKNIKLGANREFGKSYAMVIPNKNEMSHSLDLRKRVVDFLEKGGRILDAVENYQVSRQ